MTRDKIIDTNVPLVAVNTEGSFNPQCQLECVRLVKLILTSQIRIMIDNLQEAIAEYRNNMRPDPNPSAGLANQFFAYLVTNLGYEDRVLTIETPKDPDGSFVDFPSEDTRLIRFDLSDKKWVAIARAYAKMTQSTVPIINASDSDWLHFESVLADYGITIEFLCRENLKENS